MKVGQARSDELGEVLAVLSESARWLRSRGIEQWPDPFPADRVEPSIARGETYLVRVGGAVAGTITLRWADAAFWGEQPPVAGYVHAVAVRREYAGLGPKRLDCLSSNSALRAYYERHGFVHRGDTDVDDFRTSLYERRCA
jgi:hypothetical protein